jgi:hypothetical protein
MANKKISELESRASLSLSDLMAVGDPSTGYLYKTTISDLKTLTGAGVVSFNGRFGTVNPAEGDYTLTQLGDVIITSPSNGQVLKYNGSNWVNASDVTEADTLDTVTTRGNTTANSITVGSVTAAGLSNLLGQIRTFATTGNTYIGANPGSATDAGFKLDVNGTTRLNGNTTVTGVLTGSDTIRSTNGTVTVSLSYGSTAGIIGTTSNHSLEIRTNNTYRVGVSTAGVVNIANLIGTGSRMVVADSAGNLSTQAIPDLSGYLPLSGGTLTGGLIGTTGSFASSGSGDTFAINHSSGSGIALNITKGGNGEGLYINKTGGSGNAATIIGTLNATTLVKSGGTSSQFLKADGSVDSNTYATDSSVVHISGTETITGAKTFSNVTTFNQNIVGGIIKLSQGVLLSKSAAVGTDAGFLSLIATSATGLNYINIADGDAPSNTQRFAIPNTGTYTYTFPAASGTLALTSDIPSVAGVYLPLAGGTLTGALAGTTATFSGNLNLQAGATRNINFYDSSNTNINAQIQYDQISSNSGQLFFGTNNAGTFATRLTIAPTGAATFSSSVQTGGNIRTLMTGTTDVPSIYAENNVGSLTQMRVFGTSAAGTLFGVTRAGWSSIDTNNGLGLLFGTTDNAPIVIGTNNTERFRIANTGAATFSSSITALNLYTPEKTSAVYGVNTATSGGNGGNLTIKSGGGFGSGNTSGHLYLAAGRGASSAASGDIYIGRANSTDVSGLDAIYMTVKDGGSVGINTTNPRTKISTLTSGNNGSSSTVTFSTSGTAGIELSQQSNTNNYGNVIWFNNDELFAGIGGFRPSISNWGTELRFYTHPDTTTNQYDITERLKITTSGNVEITTGSIKTGEPDTGYGRAAIKIGARNTGQAFNSAGHLPVSIDGTIYYINVYSSLP